MRKYIGKHVNKTIPVGYNSTRGENKSWDNGRNQNPPQDSPIKTTAMTFTVATTTIMLINTKGSILESFLLFRGLEFGNETFHFDCGINLSRCGVKRAGCYGELWLCPLSQDLFSPRVELYPTGIVLFTCFPMYILMFKCVNSEGYLFYMDNTRQVWEVLSGHAKREEMVVEQIGRSSGSYYS